LADVNRKLAVKRMQKHFEYANHIVSMGLDVRVEKMDFKSLQARAKKTSFSKKTGKPKRKKRFGKTIANRAPGLFLTILDNKLEAQGSKLKQINTAKVKASQFNHFDQTYQKKSLSERWNHFAAGDVQRDLYSAFLIMNTTDSLTMVDISRANQTWEKFLGLHNEEIARLRNLGKKQLTCMGM
jgi:hypothetical protein